MKFNFKTLIKEHYNFFELFGIAIVYYGAMTASTLSGFIESFTIVDCAVFIVIGTGISVISMTKRMVSNNETV